MGSKVEQVTVLVGCLDARGVLRFPSDEGDFFGFTFKIHSHEDIRDFINNKVCESLKVEGGLEILEVLDKPLSQGKKQSYLVVSRMNPKFIEAPSSWPALPPILRAMESGSNRLIYNKAFQLYAGTNQHSYDVLEVDEQVRKRLQELIKNDKIE